MKCSFRLEKASDSEKIIGDGRIYWEGVIVLICYLVQFCKCDTYDLDSAGCLEIGQDICIRVLSKYSTGCMGKLLS